MSPDPETARLISLALEILVYAVYCLLLTATWPRRRTIEMRILVVFGFMWMLTTIRLVLNAYLVGTDYVDSESRRKGRLALAVSGIPTTIFYMRLALYIVINLVGHGFLAFRCTVPRSRSRIILLQMLLAMGASGISFLYYYIREHKMLWDDRSSWDWETLIRTRSFKDLSMLSFYVWQSSMSVACTGEGNHTQVVVGAHKFYVLTAFIFQRAGFTQDASGERTKNVSVQQYRRTITVKCAPFILESLMLLSVLVLHVSDRYRPYKTIVLPATCPMLGVLMTLIIFQKDEASNKEQVTPENDPESTPMTPDSTDRDMGEDVKAPPTDSRDQ
ncbi:hypothetical protein PM082_022658 [Marasmius tenuissimus]|nr:hypothetical protein PM082_022658 [Marasmius tenuissimus]